jgi:hypothetical protein
MDKKRRKRKKIETYAPKARTALMFRAIAEKFFPCMMSLVVTMAEFSIPNFQHALRYNPIFSFLGY